ncbi:MAG TPA: hypothetical protein PLK77_12170 [Pyrinomonadaceae bacterium]|nr:hypothetical protein [Pyrinomonadaceae bacterium]
MKRFVVSTMVASLAFIGAGAVVDKVIGGSKSDEKALEIIAKARTAIGGDSAISSVKSFVIKGQTSKTININGGEKIEQGETEIAFESPNRLMKMVKIGDGDAMAGDPIIERKVDVVVVGGPDEGGLHKVVVDGKDGEFTSEDGKKVIIRKVEGAPVGEAGEAKVFVRKKADGGEWTAKEDEDVKEITTADGKHITIVTKGGDGNAIFRTEGGDKMILRDKVAHGIPRDNELFRTTLSLLLTAPEGMDVSYTYAGSTNLDGTNAETVVASFGGSSVKLFFDASSYLPLGMSYVGHPQPIMIKMRKADDGTAAKEKKDIVVFDRKADGEWTNAGAEHVVRFADYRSVNGLLLPYKWTTSVAGKQSDVFDVASYDLNPANISERFKGEGHKVMVRTKKPAEK